MADELKQQIRDADPKRVREFADRLRDFADRTGREFPYPAPTPPEQGVRQMTVPETGDTPPSAAAHLLDEIHDPQAELEEMQRQREQRAQEVGQQREEATEERKGLTDRLRSAFESITPTREIMEEEKERLNVDQTIRRQEELMGDIHRLNQNAIDLMERRDAAIGATGQFGVETPFIKGEQARIAEAYDKRISSMSALMGAKDAHLKALQGHVEQARGLIKDVVDAHTYDTQLELQKVSTFIDLNREDLERLDQEYFNEIQNIERHWEQRLKEEKQEKEAVMNMALNYLEAGITINDDLETAIEKAQRWTDIKPDERVEDLMVEYPGAEIEENDSLAEAINKVAIWESRQPYEPDWELRTVGRDLYRVDSRTGERELLARGAEATPQSYREWQLAGQPTEDYATWLEIRDAEPILGHDEIKILAGKGVAEEHALSMAEDLRAGKTIEPTNEYEEKVLREVKNELLRGRSMEELRMEIFRELGLGVEPN